MCPELPKFINFGNSRHIQDTFYSGKKIGVKSLALTCPWFQMTLTLTKIDVHLGSIIRKFEKKF